jgi:hypothetical protein
MASKIPVTKKMFACKNKTQICPQNANHIDHINT